MIVSWVGLINCYDRVKIVSLCYSLHCYPFCPYKGYGFLSENEGFATALEKAGITFVGPTVENLQTFGDKTAARNMAIANKVPVVAGSAQAFATAQEAGEWIENAALSDEERNQICHQNARRLLSI